MFRDFAAVADRVAEVGGKLAKEELLAEYLASLSEEELARGAVFFSGRVFPQYDERTVGIGWSRIVEAASSITGAPREEIEARVHDRGDLGEGIAPFFEGRPSEALTLSDVAIELERIAATNGTTEKGEILVELMARLDADEARYLAKILTGELRIGLREGLVESSIAKAFGRRLSDVRRANMLVSDLGEAAVRARNDNLTGVGISLFHPIGMMLAQPEESPAKIVEQLGPVVMADDKYDGIRAQIHWDGTRSKIYSRTLDDIAPRFPEIVESCAGLPPVILDGEIVAFDRHVLPFARLQPRIGRRKLTPRLLESTPVRYYAFDVVWLEGRTLLELPLLERLTLLVESCDSAGDAIVPGDQRPVETVEEIEAAFDVARERGNEGLVLKDPQSIYTPGRRGRTWLKYKKALGTLDCVVTAAQYGHGKRRDVLSDLTFAVRRDNVLVNIGKAYSGLTDVEIAQLTEHFKATTVSRHGPVHIVEPTVVLEIAFDRIQESKRHKSGYALRFPRIARWRTDKSVDQISDIEEVVALYESQLVRERPKPAS